MTRSGEIGLAREGRSTRNAKNNQYRSDGRRWAEKMPEKGYCPLLGDGNVCGVRTAGKLTPGVVSSLVRARGKQGHVDVEGGTHPTVYWNMMVITDKAKCHAHKRGLSLNGVNLSNE
jgi:hypothetical protein